MKNLFTFIKYMISNSPEPAFNGISGLLPGTKVKLKNGSDVWLVCFYRFPSPGRKGWMHKCCFEGAGVYANFHELDLVVVK